MEGGDLSTSKNALVLYNNKSAAESAGRNASRAAESAGRDCVKTLMAQPGFPVMFTRVPASLLPDPSLTPNEKWVYVSVLFLLWLNGSCNYSLESIAALSGVSPRKVRQSIRKLCASGRLVCTRNRNRKYPDALTLPVSSPAAAPHCARCEATRPLNALNVCVVCVKQQRAELEVSAFIAEHGNVPLEIVWLTLKANGSKASQKNIERAYRAKVAA